MIILDFDDCGASGLPTRKACKDCTCGRADMDDEAAEAAPPSGCGSVSIL